MIKWREDYNLGISKIDEQHQKLFEICDRAYQLLKNDIYLDKYDKIVEILHELKDYTVYHFKSEEEYMSTIGYRKLLQHKVYHNDFIEKINNIDLNKIDEQQNQVIMELLYFIVRWIEQHILTEDKKIAAPF